MIADGEQPGGPPDTRRATRTGSPPEWGWAWPANRRILYNRASADPDGRPWSERKKLVWWDADQGSWTGHDVPDFSATKAPDFVPDREAIGSDALAGTDAFIMQADGKAWLFAPAGLVDGPMPTHYEPQDSPFETPCTSNKQPCPPAAPERDAQSLSTRADRAGQQRVPVRRSPPTA